MRFGEKIRLTGKRLCGFVFCRLTGFIVLAVGIGILLAIAIPPWLILWLISLFLICFGLLLIF